MGKNLYLKKFSNGINMNNNDSYWLSVYIYQIEPFEPLIRDCLNPLVKILMNKKDIKQFFFIRYWENGSHIRLRLNGNKGHLHEKVQPFLREYLDSFFRTKLPRQDSIRHASSSTNQSNKYNTYEFNEYIPEINRYGGNEAILVCERQFQLSSFMALEVFSLDKNWSYNIRLAKAIQLHISFVKAAGLSLKGAKIFFKYIYFNWLSKAMPSKNSDPNSKDIILEAFEKAFRSQEDIFLLIVKEVWSSDVNRLKTIPHLYSWYTENLSLLKELQMIKSISNSSDLPEVTIIEHQYVRGIYESLIHMTNNRLGILNRDESYLAYVIMKTFSCLSK